MSEWVALHSGVLTIDGRWYVKRYATGWALYTRDKQGWGPFKKKEDAFEKRRQLLRKWKSEGTYDSWSEKVAAIKKKDEARGTKKKKKKKKRK